MKWQGRKKEEVKQGKLGANHEQELEATAATMDEQGYKVREVTSVTVDAVVIKKDEHYPDQNQVLLITRAGEPHKGKWALPGGMIEYGEEPVQAVIRILKEECNIQSKEIHPELLCVNGKDGRDPRKHMVSIVYHVAVDPKTKWDIKPGLGAATIDWYNLEDVVDAVELAFDHKDMLSQYMDKEKKEEE